MFLHTLGRKLPPDEESFPPEAEYHLGLTEFFAEIIYDLIGLRTLAETFLPFEVSRRQHVDYLMIRIEGHNIMRIQPSGALSRKRVSRLNGSTNHNVRQLYCRTGPRVDFQ